MVARLMSRLRRRERLPYADDASILAMLRPVSAEDRFDLALILARMPNRSHPEPPAFLQLFTPSDDSSPLPTEIAPYDHARDRPGDPRC